MNNISTIIVSLLILILIGVIYGLYNNYNNSMESTSYFNKDQLIMLEIQKLKNKNLELEKDIESLSQDNEKEEIIVQPPSVPVPTISDDLLTMYDRKTTFDPMHEPTKRPPRHVILPILGNPYFNYPTRGFTDTYSLKGYLVKENHHHKVDEENKNEGKITENQIIKLFGREKFPNSIEYEYYVIINTGFDDKIKYFLERQTKELYDGDSVYIDIIQSKYKVKLLKDKSMVYNPYLL
jgi:hypothetical protein